MTQMILDNGSRTAVYSDGQGGAYTIINGQQVELARDNNGNWVQLDPMQNMQNPQVVSQPQVVVTTQPSGGSSFLGYVLGGVVIVVVVVVLIGIFL